VNMKQLVVYNRYLSWFFAIGYLLIHYIYPHRHGESSLVAEGPDVPKIFFMTSFVWLVYHAYIAAKMHGWPRIPPKTLRDVYVVDAWLVMLITTPIFSIPALGASQVLMGIAWVPLAIHLALNVWYTFARAPWPVLRSANARFVLIVLWLAVTAGAAVQSFPLGNTHNH